MTTTSKETETNEIKTLLKETFKQASREIDLKWMKKYDNFDIVSDSFLLSLLVVENNNAAQNDTQNPSSSLRLELPLPQALENAAHSNESLTRITQKEIHSELDTPPNTPTKSPTTNFALLKERRKELNNNDEHVQFSHETFKTQESIDFLRKHVDKLELQLTENNKAMDRLQRMHEKRVCMLTNTILDKEREIHDYDNAFKHFQKRIDMAAEKIAEFVKVMI
jgi:hypothetical protein